MSSSFLHSLALPRMWTRLVDFLGPAVGSVFLIPVPWIGAVLWLAIAQDLHHAAFGVLGVAIAEGIGRTLRIDESIRLSGGLKANALLAAIAAAWLTEPAGLPLEMQTAVVAGSAATACVLAAAITRALASTSLPPSIWAYCLVAGMLFALFPKWLWLAVQATEWAPVPTDAISWVGAVFHSFGALVFLPKVQVGVIVSIAILLWSRTAFIAAVIGWASGALTALAFQDLGLVYYWLPASYNFAIAGMALGAVFYLPGRTSLVIAAAAGFGASVLGVVLQYLLNWSAFAYLPVSSILTAWIGIGALSLAGDRSIAWRNRAPDLPPEEAWWRSNYWRRRFGDREPLLIVPVAGQVQVTQGFHGRLSHAGTSAHALDFQLPQMTIGTETTESIWGAPVIAPAAGIVERTTGHISDNPLGVCNYAENWGNHVVIRLDQGAWVMLAHLRQGTVAVKPGARVEIGTYLGQVGNSGRSPVPHLHLQVQDSPALGAPTRPFRLANFLCDSPSDKSLLRWNTAAVPHEGTIVVASQHNPAVHSVLASLAPGSAVWTAEVEGELPRAFRLRRSGSTCRITISLDEAGRHLFAAESEGTLVSSLAPDAWRVIELREASSPFLRLLGLTAPSVPYAAGVGMTWHEPSPVIRVGAAGWVALSAAPFVRQPFNYVTCKCISEPDAQGKLLTIETHVDSQRDSLPSRLICQFDLLRGPVRIEAEFQHGRVTYSLLSFEPGLPFGTEGADD